MAINFIKKVVSPRNFVFLVIALAIKLFSQFPFWVEKYYSNGIYPKISQFLTFLSSKTQFSLGDTMYCIAFAWLCFAIIKFLYLIITKKYVFNAHKFFGHKLLFLVILYIVFKLIWGLNYDRTDLHTKYNLRADTLLVQELKDGQQFIVKNLNTIRPQYFPYDNWDSLCKKTFDLYRNTDSNLWLKETHFSLKKSMFNTLQSHMGISGYYNPFSGEGQFNNKLPKRFLPFIMAHEMAHQFGYAKENEANAVAFLHAYQNKDSNFLYSMYLEMFYHAQKNIAKYDTLAVKDFKNQLNPEVKKDFEEWKSFWKQYSQTLNNGVEKIYGIYLMSNRQPLGMDSYSYSIHFMIRYLQNKGVL